MKNLLFFFFLATHFSIYAQNEAENFDMVANGVVSFYNQNDFGGIYDMYAPVLRKFQTKEEANKFYGITKQKYGKINQHKFTKFQQNYGVYHCITDKGTLVLRISIDQQKRLVSINFNTQ